MAKDTTDHQYEDERGDLAEQLAQEAGVPVSDADVAEGVLPNITLPVFVSLGRSYMSVKEIVKLRAGHILELNKNPNEPVDLMVNGKVVARGELVDVDGRLAVRLIKIIE